MCPCQVFRAEAMRKFRVSRFAPTRNAKRSALVLCSAGSVYTAISASVDSLGASGSSSVNVGSTTSGGGVITNTVRDLKSPKAKLSGVNFGGVVPPSGGTADYK